MDLPRDCGERHTRDVYQHEPGLQLGTRAQFPTLHLHTADLDTTLFDEESK